MKNIISPATLGGSPPRSRSARMDTRAKIIEIVRGGGRSSPNPSFNFVFSAEENSTNNFEVAYKKSQTEFDKATQDQTDERSLPTTATNSHDSRDDSVLGDALVEDGDTHDPGNEEDSKAPHSVFTDCESTVLAYVVTNISNPGVGFAKGSFADASVNASIHYTVEEFTSGKEEESFVDNSILEDEQSKATSPPKRRIFACGGADLGSLGNELIEDLNVTLRQIMSPMKNVKAVLPEKNDLKEMAREKILSFKGRKSSRTGDAKMEPSGNSKRISSKSNAYGKKRSDRILVGSPEYKAMMSRREKV